MDVVGIEERLREERLLDQRIRQTEQEDGRPAAPRPPGDFPDEQGAASAATQLADTSGNATATALGGVLVGIVVAYGGQRAAGITAVDWLLAAVALFGAAIAGRAARDSA